MALPKLPNLLNFKRPLYWRIIEAFIDASATLGPESMVGWYAVVQARVRIGARTNIWHNARVLADVVIGDDCMIGGGTEIGAGSTIGHRTRIQANCFLPSHTTVGSDVFIGPNVVMTDDRFPRVPAPGDPPYIAEPPTIEDGASIGAGAVLVPGVRIGKRARVAAGALVTSDVPEDTMALGAPARDRAMPEKWKPYENIGGGGTAAIDEARVFGTFT